MRRICIFLLLSMLVSACVVCAKSNKEKEKSSIKEEEVKMKLTSVAFKEGEIIPQKYTCDSVDVSPPLEISDVPEEARSLAMICDDPDAPVGTWVHWVIFNILPDTKELPEGITTEINPVIGADSSHSAVQGTNDFGRLGYGGPCPPRGPAHRYFLKLYALDIVLDLSEKQTEGGITAKGLTEMMKGHILAEASLMGKYKR